MVDHSSNFQWAMDLAWITCSNAPSFVWYKQKQRSTIKFYSTDDGYSQFVWVFFSVSAIDNELLFINAFKRQRNVSSLCTVSFLFYVICLMFTCLCRVCAFFYCNKVDMFRVLIKWKRFNSIRNLPRSIWVLLTHIVWWHIFAIKFLYML